MRIRECLIAATVNVAARRGQTQALMDAGSTLLGVRFPTRPQWVASGECTVIWSSPGQWLIEAESNSQTLSPLYTPTIAQLAAVCDQSDSRVTWEVSGDRVDAVLAKGAPIDLHPEKFPAGSIAWTRIEHIDVLLRRMHAEPVYRLSVARSFADHLWHWLSMSTAEFGCDVEGPEVGREQNQLISRLR